MDAAARTLYASLQRFTALPDFLQLWPGHGAGSACGKALGAVPQTTLGYERRFNWAFRTGDEQTFVDQVLAGQPDPPRYFAHMKRMNTSGPGLLSAVPPPQLLSPSELTALVAKGATVVDTRPAADFAAAHVPGTLNIPLNKAFTTWAGWLLPFDDDFYLIVRDDSADALDQARRDLAMIGLDRFRGYLPWGAVSGTSAATETIEQIDAEHVAQAVRAHSIHVLDVRTAAEWKEGHIAGAQHIPLGELQGRLREVPLGTRIAVHCLGGTRSAIAASVLQAAGGQQVVNFAGGYTAWRSANLPSTQTADTA